MKVYSKLFQYVPDEKPRVYAAILISSISAGVLVYGYYCIFRFLLEVMVMDDVAGAASIALKLVALFTSSALLYLLSGIMSHLVAFRLETNLRKKGIDGLMDSSFRFHDMNPSGYVRKTIDDNAAKTHMAVAHMIPDNSQAFLVPLLSIVLAFLVGYRVGIVIVILSLVCGLILKGMMGNAEFMKLYQSSLDRLSAETVEYVRGMQVVKIFGAELRSFKALHQAIVDYSNYAYDYSLSCRKAYVIYQFIFLGLIAILCIPLSFLLPGIGESRMLAVELVMVFFLGGVIMVSFMKIMWASMNIFNAGYALTALDDLYGEMKKDKLNHGSRDVFDNFDIEFDHVHFSYGENEVLDDVSFKLKENRTYAFVGHSGSGKSTIAKLLSGFYKVDGGAIRIGGHPLEEYTRDAIIDNISFVFQDSKLFKKTIYENIALAREGATREEVMNAIKLSGCDSIIDSFKDRENTLIGSKGVYLSGGEKQRIAIARAILKDSPIVIMDEASAAIDAENEYEIQKAFRNLMENRTVIMIAHRMSSIKGVDEIIVLENGRIVERGDHGTLFRRKGLYRRLFRQYEKANDWRL